MPHVHLDNGSWAHVPQTQPISCRSCWSSAFFAGMTAAPIELWPLDNILALKIVLNAALQGGAARSLRMDNLGKNVAAQLLRMEIEAPPDLPRLLR